MKTNLSNIKMVLYGEVVVADYVVKRLSIAGGAAQWWSMCLASMRLWRF